MKIYITSSWKNQHAVEMLSDCLRGRDHEVCSFAKNNHDEGHGAEKQISFEEWLRTDQVERSFLYDVESAIDSDLVVYIGPSETDAWAEVGIAWKSRVKIYGLWARGEPAGHMRKLVTKWFVNYRELLSSIDELELNIAAHGPLRGGKRKQHPAGIGLAEAGNDTSDFVDVQNPLLGIRIFMNEMCVVHDKAMIPTMALWDCYAEWCGEGHNRPLGRNRFLDQVRHFFPKVIRAQVTVRNEISGEEEVSRHRSFIGIGITQQAREWLIDRRERFGRRERED